MSHLSEFFAAERAKLAAFVRRRLDDVADADAEDMVQDVFASLFERADPLGEIGNLSAYVYRSLRNKVIDRLRARKPTLSLEAPMAEGLTLAEILPHPDLDPLGELESQEREIAFAQAFESLPELDRQIIEANEFEGISFAELSQTWNMPIGTLLSRKSRAIKRLAQAMDQHFEQPTLENAS